MKTAGLGTTTASIAAVVLGLLTYEVVALLVALAALVVGSLALWRADSLAKQMDAFLNDQRERTEAQRSKFDDLGVG